MVRIKFIEGRITSSRVSELIDDVNQKLRNLGIDVKFEYEGTGTPMKWRIWEIHNGSEILLLENARNMDVFLFFLGMQVGLSLINEM